jgi:putative ABC transport system permease protein
LVGATVLGELFDGTDPLGARVRIGRVPFEVVGVAAPRGVDLSGVDQDDMVVIPLRTAMRRVLNVSHVQSLYVQARGAEWMEQAEEEIREVLRERHRLGDKPDDFTIQNQATLLQAERQTSRSLTLLIGSVAAISLFVGGVGILAVMLIAVRERMSEIGLRRALGARRADIRLQFLVESVLVAGAGGLLGALSGAAVTRLAAYAARWPMEMSWSMTLLAMGFSCALGMLFGIYPALRAAKLQPITALRAE